MKVSTEANARAEAERRVAISTEELTGANAQLAALKASYGADGCSHCCTLVDQMLKQVSGEAMARVKAERSEQSCALDLIGVTAQLMKLKDAGSDQLSHLVCPCHWLLI